MKIFEEILKLEKICAYHDDLYYNKSSPEITDYEYDLLKEKLNKLKKIAGESNNVVGAKPNDNNFLKKVKHKNKMFSLNNIFSENELVKFIKSINRFLKINDSFFPEIFAELKIDGLSLSLIYENCKLKSCVTRGDGEIGEDVTQNGMLISDIPQNIIHNSLKNFEIRGEVYLRKDNFELIKKENEFTNPRNAASGILRRKNSKNQNISKNQNVIEKEITKYLSFIAYEIITTDLKIKTQFEVTKILDEINFKTSPEKKICKLNEEINLFYNYIKKIRKKIEFNIDGIVLKINERILQEKLGYTERAPRHSIAYKFTEEEFSARLNEIEISVSKNGTLTPIAKIEPVKIDGTLIRKITLHNFNFIIDNDINVNDLLVIKKAGDVIPKIISVLKRNHSEKYKLPTFCPSCKKILINFSEKNLLICENNECQEKFINKLKHFIGKDGFNIVGLGEENLKFLVSSGRIKKFSDVFLLKKNDDEKDKNNFFIKNKNSKRLFEEDGWGIDSTKKLFKEIDEKKKIKFDKFLVSLGIQNISKKAAKIIAKNIDNIENIMSLNLDELKKFKGLGECASNSLLSFFNDENNIFMVKEIINEIEIIYQNN